MTTATRITRKQLDELAHDVSDKLTSDLYVTLEGRNGKTALELYDASGSVRTLQYGTKREVFDYLAGMIATLEIIGR